MDARDRKRGRWLAANWTVSVSRAYHIPSLTSTRSVAKRRATFVPCLLCGRKSHWQQDCKTWPVDRSDAQVRVLKVDSGLLLTSQIPWSCSNKQLCDASSVGFLNSPSSLGNQLGGDTCFGDEVFTQCSQFAV